MPPLSAIGVADVVVTSRLPGSDSVSAPKEVGVFGGGITIDSSFSAEDEVLLEVRDGGEVEDLLMLRSITESHGYPLLLLLLLMLLLL